MLLYLAGAVLTALLFRTLWRRWKYDLHKIPSPPGLPLLGHTLALMTGSGNSTFTQFVGNSWKQLGHPNVFRINLSGTHVIIVRDTEIAKNVVMNRKHPFPKATGIVKNLHIILGNDKKAKSLTCVKTVNAYTKAVRMAWATSMQSSNLKRGLPHIEATILKMMDMVESKAKTGAVEVQDLCVCMALDAIGACTMEMNLGGLDHSRNIRRLVLKVGNIIRKCISNPFRVFLMENFPKSFLIRKDTEIVDQLTTEYERVTDEIMQRDDPVDGHRPLWYELKTMIDPETGKPVPKSTLLVELATIIVGGTEANGYQLSWILGLLALNPRVAEKLREEMSGLGLLDGPGSRDLCFEDFSTMKYLSAVVKESMRISTVSDGSFFREIPHDITIAGYRMPVRTAVLVVSNRFMDSEEEWGDPDAFRPERWLEDPDINNKYYFGFSMGPRDCIGQKIALLFLRASVFYFVKRFTFSMEGSQDAFLTNTAEGLSITAVGGVNITFTAR